MTPESFEFAAPIQRLLAGGSDAGTGMPAGRDEPSNSPQLAELRSMSAQDLFGESAVVHPAAAECVRAGLFLYFFALEDSHKVSQAIATPSGSYWHGLMHRQERDWNNAKYWFRRVGTHPVFGELERVTGQPWDPFRFVDLCADAFAGRGDADEAAALQMLEWQLLMRHCYQDALGE